MRSVLEGDTGPSTSPGTGVVVPVTRRMNDRWPGMVLALVVALVHTASRVSQSGDSRLSALTAWSVLRHGDLRLNRYAVVRGLSNQGDLYQHHGSLLPAFPWPPMLLAAPADLVAAALHRTPSVLDPANVLWIEIPTASVLVGMTAWLVYRFLLDTGYGVRTAFASGAVFGFATSAWSIGSRALWQQTVSMLLLTAAVLLLQRCSLGLGRAIALGAVLGLAFVCRPTNVTFVAFALLWLVIHRRALIGTAVGLAAVVLPFLLFSHAQYGAWLPPYYVPSRLQDPSHYSFLDSLALVLVSPARGLLIYDPIILLAAVGVVLKVRRDRFSAVDVLMVATFFGQLAIIASYGSTNGFTYGPRLMLDVVPFLVIQAAPVLSAVLNHPAWPGPPPTRHALAILTVGVLTWSVFVNATGAVLRAAVCWNEVPVSVDEAPVRVWDWSDLPFTRPYRQLADGRSLRDVAVGPCTA